MPPTNPRGKKPPQRNSPLSGSSDVQSVKQNNDVPKVQQVKSQYEEIQEDELIALEAIYGEDFKRIESNHSAWKKAEPCFEIRVKSSDEEIAITLAVTLTATYPRSTPLLRIKDYAGLREGTKFKIQKVMETKPKELVAEEQAMIMEIVNACQEVLEDAAQANAVGKELPSLEEERAIHEQAVSKLAEEQREAEEKKKQLETMEEERTQQAMVQEEIRRRRERTKESRRKNRPPPQIVTEASIDTSVNGQAAHELLAFEQPINFTDLNDNPIVFQVVASKVCIRRGPVSKCFTVRPVVAKGASDVPTLILKQTDLATEVQDNNKFKAQIQLLENELKILKDVRHKNVLEILDFKVHRTMEEDGESDSGWTVSILTEFGEKGSLQEFLDIAGRLEVEKVRSWTIEILDALRFLHEKGIVHEDIHAGNVILVRMSNGEFRPKLADAGYQRKLYNLSGEKPSDTLFMAKSAYWFPPEIANTNHPQYTQKTDVWDFGVFFLQMMFGLAVIQIYQSPIALAESLALSDSLNELVLKMFNADSKKRPRAVELGPSEFLATDAPILDEMTSSVNQPRFGSEFSLLPTPRRQRHDSMNTGGPFNRSRYTEDFVEEGRLGKGGFGEVVKARKRLDGQIYAIKKIMQKSSASLTQVLKEVRLLSQLSHPSVVRYYNTWTEELYGGSESDEDATTTDAATEDSASESSPEIGPSIEFGVGTGGLDFMSSRGYPHIEFGFDDGSDEDEDSGEDEESDDSSSAAVQSSVDPNQLKDLAPKRTRSGSRFQRPFRTVLYISMEYCEKKTLRDLIRLGLQKDQEEIWRLFRQVLEGLAHIHGLNIVHRDLKPENIFIDAASNVKIGDFGLATSGQYTTIDKSSSAALHLSGDMTRSIGTAFYVAPEVRSSAGGSYTSKVDMYSLGIIFFEMCFRPLVPGMDRARVGEGLRQKQPVFPAEFKPSEFLVQTDIILSLLNHSPKDRPSSSELLKSGKLPMQMENETIRQALAGLTDSKSPYYDKAMQALFTIPISPAKDYAWEMGIANHSASDLLLQGLVKQKLISIFRHHGAVETPRTLLFPRSGHYGSNAVQVLDAHGNLLQLPYDLTLPHARAIAKHDPPVQRSFAFGRVFRDREVGGQPLAFGEVDFDIVSSDTLDLALKEAEVIKVLDEIVGSFPSLAATQMCFHINHSDLLGLIFEFCRIEPSIRQAVADTLSKLNIQSYTWQKIRTELRSPVIGVSAPSVDDLQSFDFRDTPSKAFSKLKALFEGTDTFERAASSIAHLRDVFEYTKRFDVHSKIYISPLGSLQEKFCKGGIVFSCLFDRKVKDVFAAGGRYDSLVREHGHKNGGHSEARHAVGFNLAWEKMARLPKASAKGFLKKVEEDLHGIWKTKRASTALLYHDAAILRSVGVDIVQSLWRNDISAELARDSRSPEDLTSQYRDNQHSWVVIIKQDSILKVKSQDKKDDVDIHSTQLLAWLNGEIRERDQRNGIHQRTKLQRHGSQADSGAAPDHEQDVRVLVAGTKSKKSNRRNIVEQAQARARSVAYELLDGPIAAIETTDQVMELIRGTRLSDQESWRQVTQTVQTSEKRYLGEIQDLMNTLAHQNKDITRNSFIYNFRTGKCIYYDLGA
ncbi:protein kinase [Drepanopeziza brunnea f. sp. 'multigermtubi' MB_m1]|uniref:non-specific serine/threonine protein kinase n=1 Tax=Marssonina brunnea f. sp. multigermtubi (strain MB_m1) TaxID=1072389 RepID=K1WXX2_MARBU|nr:protein kinase [Drepanopeziza brunnea f. sp. 'multigermtubi' MB_m1]EKD13488.1 protein kinase [Drepanopeziza brunnea f. sp. 'multigermtubi' MB_m1]